MLIRSDARNIPLADESVQCCVTSPPYWGLRSYHGGENMIGLEPTFDEHLANLVDVFREVWRVLRKDGTVWLNYGDAYTSGGRATYRSGASDNKGHQVQDDMPRPATPNGLKPKDLMFMPARMAMALQADGWYVRSKIIWHKPNPMPESVTDRPTNAYEEMFLLSKSGDKLFWTHRAFPGVRVQPEPDYVYRLWEKVNGQRVLKKETPIEPAGWRDNDNWQRVNLWVGHDYFYDSEAVRVPCLSVTQGKGEVVGTPGESTAHDRRHDFVRTRSRAEQAAMGANLRNVWTIPTQGFSGWQSQIDLTRLSASQVREHADSGSGAGGDMARITSPDCPVHAGRPDLVPKGFCDGLGADQLRHMRDTFRDHDQARFGAGSGNGLTPDRCRNAQSTQGSCDREDSGAATLHSSETHRMAPAPASSPRAIASAETDGRTGRTEPPQTTPALIDRDTDGNRTEGDTSRSAPSNSSPGTADRSPRNSKSECACLYYTKVVSKVSHFATYPEKLVEPCILAGTSAEGACAKCGAPWARVVENTPMVIRRSERTHDLGRTRSSGTMVSPAVTETLGWQPTCECEAAKVPCTVLDPFVGSGTTLRVATRLNRRGIGCDLGYQDIAVKRTTNIQRMLLAD